MKTMASVLILLQILPVALNALITAAEAAFGAGNGSKKAAQVVPELTNLVTVLGSTGVINPAIATGVTAAAPALVSGTVQLLNLFGRLPKRIAKALDNDSGNATQAQG